MINEISPYYPDGTMILIQESMDESSEVKKQFIHQFHVKNLLFFVLT